MGGGAYRVQKTSKINSFVIKDRHILEGGAGSDFSGPGGFLTVTRRAVALCWVNRPAAAWVRGGSADPPWRVSEVG